MRRPASGAGGTRRGQLIGEFHAVESPSPVRGVVARTRVVVVDRRLESSRQTYPTGEPEILWQPVPESLRFREVTGPAWDFSRDRLPRGAHLGDIARGDEDGVLVDLLPDPGSWTQRT